MLIYDVLKKDHDRIKFLLSEIAELTEDDVKWHSSLISQLQAALVPHSKAEEESFYDAIHMKDKGKNIALRGYQEHLSAEYLLRTLRLKDRLDQDWKSTALQLKTVIEHHISDEENAIFPLAQTLFTDEEAYLMGLEFVRLRAEFRKEPWELIRPDQPQHHQQSEDSSSSLRSPLNKSRLTDPSQKRP